MSELVAAVRVSEDVKVVADASRRISLVALNALLTARQAGARSRGFSVVSRELRQLAARLEAVMADIDLTVSELVHDLAATSRGARLLGSLEATLAATAEPHPALAATLTAARGRHRARQAEVADCWRRLRQQVGQASRLTEMGLALSRSARIESVYGGDMAATMGQVAGQVESAIEGIGGRLKGIGRLALR